LIVESGIGKFDSGEFDNGSGSVENVMEVNKEKLIRESR
jgi:hypothetical protein